jgi:hypothetical protein
MLEAGIQAAMDSSKKPAGMTKTHCHARIKCHASTLEAGIQAAMGSK